jgi:long-chain acyl-CoA synthetase
LRLIDRKKNIFKLSQGEFVVPTKCEHIFIQSKFLDQIYVHGNMFKPYLVGVCVGNKPAIFQLAHSKGLIQDANNVSNELAENLCKNNVIVQAVLDDLNIISTLNQLRPYERVQGKKKNYF